MIKGILPKILTVIGFLGLVLFLISAVTSYISNTPVFILALFLLPATLAIIFLFMKRYKLLLIFSILQILLGVFVLQNGISGSYGLLYLDYFISSLIVFVGGLLAFKWKIPKSQQKTGSRSRKALIAGCCIQFIWAVIFTIGLYFSIPSILNNITHSNSTPLFLSSYVNNFYSLLFLYFLLNLIIFLALIYAAIKTRSGNKGAITKWAKVAFILAFISALMPISAVNVLFLDGSINPFGFTSDLSNIITIFSTASTSIQNLLQATVSLLMGVIVFIIIFIGGILAIAGSATILWEKDKKYVITVFFTLLMIIVIASLVSNYITVQSNKVALKELNQKIYKYGGNIRYLLSNSTLFYQSLNATPSKIFQYQQNYSQLYGILYNPSTNQTSIAELFNSPFSKSNSNISQSVNQLNWGNENPIIRVTILSAINFSLLIPIVNATSNNQKLLVPKQVTDLEDMYQIQTAGYSILYIAVALGRIFESHIFSGVSNLRPSYGVGTIYSGGNFGATGSVTNLLKSGDYYDFGISQFSNNWLSLVFAVGNPFQNINTSRISIRSIFYLFSTTQYESYLFSQIFYNHTISPNIDFIGYSSNTLIINLGNMNLTTNYPITTYVDGNKINYTSYYNFLLSNIYLRVGLHKINVSIGNTMLNQVLYISPLEINSPMILPHNGSLVMSLNNPYYNNLSISNITISSNPSSFDYVDASFHPSPTATPQFSAYVKYNITKDAYNDTIRTPIYSNKTLLSQASAYNLQKNKTFDLFFNTNNCTIGESRLYFFSADTNYGKIYSAIQLRCT